MARDHRPKASELSGSNTLFFGLKVPFQEAFPEVTKITVETDEYGYGTDHYLAAPTRRVYDQIGEFVDCSNPRCYGGGISISGLVRDMVRERKAEGEISGVCRGCEGSPKGRRKNRECINTFKIKVKLSFK